MNPLLAICLAVLATMPVATPGLQLQLDFAVPAQLQGSADAQGLQWVLLVFHEPSWGAFNLTAPAGASSTNYTVFEVQQKLSSENGHTPVPVKQPPQTLQHTVDGRLLAPRLPWVSLYVEAEAISLQLDGGTMGLTRTLSSDHAIDMLPPHQMPTDAVDESVPVPVQGVAINGLAAVGRSLPVKLSATGLHRVQWHNMTLDCPPSSSCPDSGRPWSAPFGPGPNRIQRLSYIDVASSAGTLQGSGQVWSMAGGGTVLDAALEGHVRLPDAHMEGECKSKPCPDAAGKTFLADGHVVLRNLRCTCEAQNRVQASMEGTLQSASFDESPITFKVAEGAVTGAALLGLGFLVKYLLGLLVRSARPPALQHRRRRQVFDAVQNDPGLSFRELQRTLGMATGVLQNHLGRLLEAGLVVAQPYRNTVRYFETQSRHAQSWKELAELRDPAARKLHEWIVAHPGRAQAEVLAFTSKLGWSRTATQRRIDALRLAGLVLQAKQGREVRYSARSPVVPS